MRLGKMGLSRWNRKRRDNYNWKNCQETFTRERERDYHSDATLEISAGDEADWAVPDSKSKVV